MRPAARKFEDIRVGDEASFMVVVDESLVDRFTQLTGDRNPLHVDEHFAARTMYGRRVVHGMLLASHFSTLIGMHLPGASALYLSQDIRFVKPVFVGDRVRVLGRVIATSPATRVLTILTQVLKEHDEVIVDGEAKVMVQQPRQEAGLPERPMSFSLSGGVALVTGASRGIGAAIAALLAQHGAAVALNYRESREEAEEVERRITAAGGKAVAVQADVSREESVHKMFGEVAERLGPVGILVNNASSPLRPAPFEQTEWTDLERDLAVTVGGAYHCVRAAVPAMVAAKAGVIVNIVTSYVFGTPPTQLAGYVMAKHALLGLTKALAVELGPKGIRVNAVAPGLTDTTSVAYLPPRFRDVVAHQTPLRRIAAPEDTARVIVFLASEAANFLSGVCLPVNGGAAMP